MINAAAPAVTAGAEVGAQRLSDVCVQEDITAVVAAGQGELF
jgi:hypothetical protein